MRIISVINQKGGVGKTTVSVNLSFELATEERKVLLIDLDPQAHSSCIFSDGTSRDESIGVIFERGKKDIKSVIRSALLNTEKKDSIKNLHIIPSTIHLALTAEQAISRIHKEKILATILESIRDDYDYIILDCSPTLNVLNLNALFASESIIIPTTYSRYALDGISDLLNTIEEIKEGEKYTYKILRNIFDPRISQTNRLIDNQLKELEGNLFKTIIHKNEAINQSQIMSIPVSVFSTESRGAMDFKALAKEVITYEK